MKPILLLDCDGILTNYVAQTIEVLNALQTKIVFTEDMITDWELTHHIPYQLKDAYWQACRSEGFVKRMRPFPEAVVAVEKLKTLAEVFVVTSYLKGAKTWTHERDVWLKRHFDFEPDHIIHTRAKDRVHGHILVDDALKNVGPWHVQHPAGSALLWDRLYNQSAEAGSYKRISSWYEVEQAVRWHRS